MHGPSAAKEGLILIVVGYAFGCVCLSRGSGSFPAVMARPSQPRIPPRRLRIVLGPDLTVMTRQPLPRMPLKVA